MGLKADIEQHLAPLIGLKWSIARKAADMAVFHFGTIRPHHSGSGTVGEYALHIQGPWRIETNADLYVTLVSAKVQWKTEEIEISKTQGVRLCASQNAFLRDDLWVSGR